MNIRNICHHTLPYFFASIGLLGIYLGGAYQGLGIGVIFIVHPLFDFILTKAFGEIKSNPSPPSNFSLYLWPLFQTSLIFSALYFLSLESSTGFQILGAISLGIITGGFGITISHEFIHRPNKWEIGFGVFLLSQVSYSVFRIEHVFGHHRKVATPDDPASAKKGETIYGFIPKAIVKTYISALELENRFIKKKGHPFYYHRFLHYFLLQLFWLVLIYFIFGINGMLLFLVQSLMAIILLELIDYIEHYGLQRKEISPGKYQPVGPEHSWDTNFFLTNTSLFNLGKHAHHHQKAGVPYQKLTSTPTANQYPFGYSWAIILSLIPPLWFSMIHPRLKS